VAWGKTISGGPHYRAFSRASSLSRAVRRRRLCAPQQKSVDVETYNDLDLRISRLFRVLRDEGERFLEKVRLIPYSQVEAANTYPDGGGDLEKAICDFVRWRQSFGGKGTAWSYTTGRARGGMAGDVNAWWTAIEGLPLMIDRLRRVQIICQSAFDAIPRFDP
jgi:hypothetical protein